ncbi:MAG: Holliday junction resolvase RuvX [Acidimicrobiales bacterium]
MTEEGPAGDLGAAEVVPDTGRLLGIDLGSVRVGVALCDTEQRVATALCVLTRSNERAEDHVRLSELAREYGAVGVVVGLPRSLSGRLGPAAQGVLEEVATLRSKLPLPVATSDERLTTVLAQDGVRGAARARGARGSSPRIRRESGQVAASRRPVDASAAALILQTWLEGRRAGRV